MNWPDFYKKKQPERLATPQELAEFGGGPGDPMSESQILALIEEQMGDELKNAAEESAAKAKVRALRELAAMLGPEPPKKSASEATEPGENLEDEIQDKETGTGSGEFSSEAERVAAAFFGADDIEAATKAKEVEEIKKVNEEKEEKEEPSFQQALEVKPEPARDEKAKAHKSEGERGQGTAEEVPVLAARTDETPSLPAETVLRSEEETRELRTELLAVAEALDQHRLWAETGGKEGIQGDFAGSNLCDADLTGVNLQGAEMAKSNLRGADLSMANLRGANLVEADLRETNLLGTELAGANLMGANLYGAQGLWAGRLGGTNLFDASLPEAVGALDGGKTIGQFTQSARRFYLLVMGLCAVACGLVALTTDVRLLLDESATVTARIPNFLPLQGFYLGAPLLLTVLYFRMQFLLLRLWGSMSALPAVFPDGQTPEKDGSWYLMGPIRTHLRWTRDPRSPLAMVECVLAKLLAYWAVPATLFVFWLRYLVMQDYRGTLLQVFLLTLVAGAACAMPRVVKRVLRPGEWTDESTKQFMHNVLAAFRVPVAAGLVIFLLSLGVIRGLPADPTVRPDILRGDPRRWASTMFQSLGYRPYADVTEESVSPNVAKQTGDGDAGNGTGPRLNEINLRYSRGYRSQFAGARMWKANLEGASLSEADFAGANLREANLRGANLDHMHAAKANLVSANAQGAMLAGADFRNADLSFANLEAAALTTANFQHATLYSVILRQANLLRADLGHADFRDVKLEGSVLSLASMEQTDLSAARLIEANLTGAQAKGTIFLEADLSKADLRGAAFPGAILRQAKLDGARVEGADFRGALGLEAWQVCSMQGWRGAQFDADVLAAVMQSCGATSGIQ
jgi:uncharacterized protein YjbI with pentapeptide repeats